jgi:hypothetical protein
MVLVHAVVLAQGVEDSRQHRPGVLAGNGPAAHLQSRPVGQQCPADPTRCAGRCLGQSTGVFLDLYLQSRNRPIFPRERTSNAFVHENNDGAILVSYGADGADQLSGDIFSTEGDTTLVADFFAEYSQNGAGAVNHPFNTDNLYSSEYFANRIRPQPN